MFTAILMYIILLFSILGLTYCIENLWLYFLHPKNAPKRKIIIYLDANTARMQINEILEELKWRGENKIEQVIFTNNNIDGEEFIKLKNEFENDKLIFTDRLENKHWTP